MKLLLIRHGDPDYEHDTLTEKGWREVRLLAERLEKLPIRSMYCSPLGRAQDTARETLKRMRREATVLDWLQEFPGQIKDPNTGENRIPWNLLPSYWTRQPELYDKDHWLTGAVMSSGNVKETYQNIACEVDKLLAEYGYHREGLCYRTQQGNQDTLVFFCHLGVQFAILSHLLGLSPAVLWQSFFVAPSSVTTVVTEEREKGIAVFRCQALGDTSHLYAGGECVSPSGLFEEMAR